MTALIDQSNFDQADMACDTAHAWRSECIQQFAKLEIAITDALHALRETQPTLKVKEGLPFKGAFDELVRCTAKFGTTGQAVAKSLASIGPLVDWRAHLTHGVLELWQGKSAELLTLQHREPAGGVLRRHAMTREEATDFLQRLEKEVRDLKSRLGLLRKTLNPSLINSRTRDPADKPSA